MPVSQFYERHKSDIQTAAALLVFYIDYCLLSCL